jgi:4,5-DOPA dioxygenase extradiol
LNGSSQLCITNRIDMQRRDFIKRMAILPLVGTTMNLNAFDKLLSSYPESNNLMPALFCGHGSPMNAIESNAFTLSWSQIGKTIPTPTFILCISAHWETRGTFVTVAENPQTIHDFYGFPDKLFAVQYPAPGSPELANSIMEMITSPQVKADQNWGLDHGTWSVLRNIYPDANIPVVQLSLDHTMKPADHVNLAKQLRKLRKKGVLIVGSGNMVHNLRQIDWRNPEGGFDWAEEANTLYKKLIKAGDIAKLSDYTSLGKAIQLSIPTAEHYLPLLYILALANENENIDFFNDKCIYGSLSMTSIKVA